ncbi:hypothetical protein EJB05_03480, partial [Eragrostis curvula]
MKQDANFMSRPFTFASKTISGGYKDAVLSPYGDQWKKMCRVFTTEIIFPSRHKWLHDKCANEAENLTRYVYNLISAGGAVDIRYVVIRRLVFNKRYFGEPQADGGPGPLEVQHVDAFLTSVELLYTFCVSDYLPWLLGLDLDDHEKMLKDVEGNPLLTIEEVKSQAKVRHLHVSRCGNPSNTVEWDLAEMVNNPEVMAKAMEELDLVVGRERLVQESDIPWLNYIKACIREAFCVHPVAPFNIPHVALANTTIAGYHWEDSALERFDLVGFPVSKTDEGQRAVPRSPPPHEHGLDGTAMELEGHRAV